MTRISGLTPGATFVLKRTGDRYEFLGHKRDTPGGTQYVVRRVGTDRTTTLHHSCLVELMEQPNVPPR